MVNLDKSHTKFKIHKQNRNKLLKESLYENNYNFLKSAFVKKCHEN